MRARKGLGVLGVQLDADVTAIKRYRKPRDRFFFSDGTLAVATGNTDESNARSY